jgi:chromate reductase, NAD(P)H dehydrogenase (quinone)
MRVLGLNGSLRKESFNGALLRAAAEYAPVGMEVVVYRLHELPHYNGDDDPKDVEQAPNAVRAFRNAVESADALLCAVPEFSHSYPGVLKNALDWLSASDSLARKPAASISAAPNDGGGVRGQLAIREVFFALGCDTFVNYELLVRQAKVKFTEGKLTDVKTVDQLTKFLEDFAVHAQSRKER